MHRFSTIIAAFAVLLSSCGKQATEPSVSNSVLQNSSLSSDAYRLSGLVVFNADYSGVPNVHSMNSDGSNVVNLTNSAFEETHPHLSPDGQQIVFSRLISGVWRPFLINVDGTGEAELSIFPGSGVANISWSPDGTQIGFHSDADGGDWDLFIYSFADGSILQVTENSDTDWAIDWTPDGEWIAFSNDETGTHKIYIARPDGSERQRLTNSGPSVEERGPRISPDGSRVVFSMRNESTNWDLLLINIDGSGKRRLTRRAGDQFQPGWAPSGDQIVFGHSLNSNRGLYLVDLQTNVKSVLVDAPGVDEENPDWVAAN